MWALSEDMNDGGNEMIDFDGGYYLTYAYKDGDEETNGKLYGEALKYIEASEVFELDVRPTHYAMGKLLHLPKLLRIKVGHKWKHLSQLA